MNQIQEQRASESVLLRVQALVAVLEQVVEGGRARQLGQLGGRQDVFQGREQQFQVTACRNADSSSIIL